MSKASYCRADRSCATPVRGAIAGTGCGYAGPPVADINDNPTRDATADASGKRLKSCKLRFGNGRLPFGGFPGAGRYR
ncbi:hypothetical protein [Caballeronia sp. Lep1P3]|uniref:hypothetical protein n=1 Tax=Caballeronia sp. Lep1P3 TaxID=2878150 RepID=UPI001FD3F667|nr:hypothetical protein [Caballeronia sp. Lep1P3]